jgi:REP element-mobilizing transposase RayT
MLYHFVCPAKYRRAVFNESVGRTIKDICLEISKRYQIHFLEIGTDKDRVHFLLQSVPTNSATKIVMVINSLTAREIFRVNPEVKRQLWGGKFWTDGYLVNTVSRFGDESTISKYVQEHGREKEYKFLHKAVQLTLGF